MSQEKWTTLRKKDALDYHALPRPGKLEISPTKPLADQRDLALAYSPGVAEPARAIAANPADVFRYTNRGNLVGVVTNGTATLGLGNVGPLAAKPVMEGKAVLFKVLAGIDAYDVELATTDPEVVITCVRALEPTFGGINLEDISAPACFYIEEQLRKTMEIPVFHDDQHGTAIITGAALLNALELQEKRLEDVRVVFSGAGAAAVACARLYVSLGVRIENILMCDIFGVLYKGRKEEMDRYREPFARETPHRTLAQAMVGADVFVGLSVGGIVTQDMVKTMADRPIIFALANPDPEISYSDVTAVRSDAIIATGRSDFPNQVNNVLGFPFMFRGALDVAAKTINEEMKIAAVKAIATLAHEEVPDVVAHAYGSSRFHYGKDYVIPKPFDPRALLRVAPAVAQAAMDSGVARKPLDDLVAYRERLERTQSAAKGLIRQLINKGVKRGARLCFPEGDEESILRAAQILLDEKIAVPVLLGNRERILQRAEEFDLDLDRAEIICPEDQPDWEQMVAELHKLRHRKGIGRETARSLLRKREYAAMMLLRMGRVDGVLSGVTKPYKESIRPALEIIGVDESVARATGMHIVVTRHHGVKLFADTTVHVSPDAETLARVAITAADAAISLDIHPRIAMLSFSNFGTSRSPDASKVALATRLVKQWRPDLEVDGEMQLEVAVNAELRTEKFPFCTLTEDANVLIFPDLNSGNIGYKLMAELAGAEVIGPLLLGMKQPVNVMQYACSVQSIVHLAVITSLQAVRLGKR
ncbi:MAG: NADP-dependent malic enzyme [Myxococcales bacterium]|nr:NADP-dependent malic enzyme [Myxococcales bacterium]